MKKILGWLKYNENKEEKDETNEKCETCECETCECEGKDESLEEFDFDTLSLEEKKKLPAALQAYIDKKKGKKGKKEDDKDSKGKKSKPDFLDLDKDGDKKEPMKKASEDAKKKKGDK
jgi:hypothetical protein